jgi:WD40 repeat protein
MPPAPIELLPAEARTNHPVVAWGPGGRHVAIATDEVSVWEVRSKKRLSRFSLPQPHGVIALSGDARWFATRNLGGAPTLALWDVRAGKVHAIWKCSLETLNNLQFSPDGSLLAAGNMDNSVILWEVPDGKVRTILNGHTLAVWALAFSSDARTLVTRGSDGLRLWNTATAQEIASLDIRGADGFALAPDDRALVVLRENRLMVDIVPLATEITGAKR